MGWKVAQKVFRNWKILRGDKVVITAGKDRGQTGIVQRVLRDKNAVIVEGKNLNKRHIKKTEDQPGGVVSIEAPIHVSNVSLLDPVNGNPCRVAHQNLEDGTRMRVSVGRASSNSVIPRPDILKERRKPKPEKDGPKDTKANEASKLTWNPNTREGGLPPVIFRNNRWEIHVEAMKQ